MHRILIGISTKEKDFLNNLTKKLQGGNGILLSKLFWPTVRKSCSSDGENRLKFEVEGREFVKCLISLEQFIQTVKGQNNFGNRMLI